MILNASMLPRVLVVDSNPVRRYTLANVAKELGLAALSGCGSVEHATSLIRTHDYDALVLGDLPPVEMLDFIRVVRDLAPTDRDVKLVVLLPEREAAFVEQFKEAGASCVLLKPYQVEDVFVAIHAGPQQ